MMVNLVANPKASTPNLTLYNQPTPVLVVKPVRTNIVLFVPGLTVDPPTPEQVAAAIWSYPNRTLT